VRRIRSVRAGEAALVASETGVDAEATRRAVGPRNAGGTDDALVVVVRDLATYRRSERRVAVGRKPLDARAPAPCAAAAARGRRDLRGALAATLEGAIKADGPALTRDHIDDAADGAAAEECALRTTQDLDAVDVRRRKMRRVEAAAE